MTDDTTPPTLTCERHGEATRISCVACGTPVCPKCMVRTPVGHKCVSCADDMVHGGRNGGDASRAGSRSPTRVPRWGVAAVVVGLVMIVAAVFVLQSVDESDDVPDALDPVGSWESLPGLTTIRGTAAVTRLEDGSVLAAGGGVGSLAVDAAEVFADGGWSVAASMMDARRGASAVPLDDGRILVAGGIADNQVLASSEIYDPSAGTWTSTGDLTEARVTFTMTRLPDGRVLAVGGSSPSAATGSGGGQTIQPTDGAEVFDPSTGRWEAVAPMADARFEHTASPLADGRVLVAGGFGGEADGGAFRSLASAEIFDPAVGAFTTAGTMADGRANHVAVTIDGGVVVAGGITDDGTAPRALGTVERYDPATGGWVGLPAMRQARSGAAAVALDGNRVLVVGGEAVQGGSRRSLDSAELLELGSDEWTSAGRMACPRSEFAAVLLDDGSVLAVAGDAAFPGEPPVARGCVDRYDPGDD